MKSDREELGDAIGLNQNQVGRRKNRRTKNKDPFRSRFGYRIDDIKIRKDYLKLLNKWRVNWTMMKERQREQWNCEWMETIYIFERMDNIFGIQGNRRIQEMFRNFEEYQCPIFILLIINRCYLSFECKIVANFDLYSIKNTHWNTWTLIPNWASAWKWFNWNFVPCSHLHFVYFEFRHLNWIT